MLTAEERMELDVLRNHGQGIRKLARVTGRLHNTVPRCLREGEAAAVRKPARKTAAKRKNARYADFLEEVLRADACAGARDADASQRTRRSRLTTSRSPPAPSQIQELASLGFVARTENVASANGRLDKAGRLTRMPNCPGIWGSFIFKISTVRSAKRKPA
jgi:hypothetical protein